MKSQKSGVNPRNLEFEKKLETSQGTQEKNVCMHQRDSMNVLLYWMHVWLFHKKVHSRICWEVQWTYQNLWENVAKSQNSWIPNFGIPNWWRCHVLLLSVKLTQTCAARAQGCRMEEVCAQSQKSRNDTWTRLEALASLVKALVHSLRRQRDWERSTRCREEWYQVQWDNRIVRQLEVTFQLVLICKFKIIGYKKSGIVFKKSLQEELIRP